MRLVDDTTFLLALMAGLDCLTAKCDVKLGVLVSIALSLLSILLLLLLLLSI